MPIISIFYGITVSMYFGDHPPPHVHVEYQGTEALVRLSDATIIRGKLAPTTRRLVRRWIALHREALEANFQRVQDYQQPEHIPGLDA